jgi:hypothetical protein
MNLPPSFCFLQPQSALLPSLLFEQAHSPNFRSTVFPAMKGNFWCHNCNPSYNANDETVALKLYHHTTIPPLPWLQFMAVRCQGGKELASINFS